MIRSLLSWLRPDPPGIRHRLDRITPPHRYVGETLRDFRCRQVDAVLATSDCYDMREEAA